MPFPPIQGGFQRSPRTWFMETTPAVLRQLDGRCIPGKVQVISATGGLLTVPKPLDRFSRVKLMFLSPKGTIFGTAEMLGAVSWNMQPFKFVKLYDDDEERLRAAIQSCLNRSRKMQGQMDWYRAW